MPDSNLTAGLLLRGYAAGVFPMSESRDSAGVYWVDPERRGILPLDGFRISRSLARRIRRGGYRIAVDSDFDGVVEACAGREETWINRTLSGLYGELHRAGRAHSLEVWMNGELAGGVYGVTSGGAFFGESMFSLRTDASKIALAHLVDRLNRAGFELFDVQFLTPHLASLGAVEIPRDAYRRRLRAALSAPADFAAAGTTPTAQEVLQRNSQTSYRG